MKRKKLFLKIGLALLIVLSAGAVGGCIYWRLKTVDNTSVDQVDPKSSDGTDGNQSPGEDDPKNPSNSDGKPDNHQEPAFKKENLKIGFDQSETLQMIKFENYDASLRIDMFKYFFMSKFAKLGPTNDSISLNFKFDSKLPTKVSVKYIDILKNPYTWNFEIHKK
ncbi:hypothetical protein SCLARK_00437 [Spiroplasma clarkii]|uniref:Lipoprotein n=1 Tax=Spiroplasma clarkii TaxID=2139 RepID=A0A1Y0L0C4_9MOLU|nr:hypothetical protein [Spiroplasma clarkii]ARU91159.1 hypothetical protein SCLARK_00437 [Spiroplasma clarkii]ATX70597.1 hypothetical protein SCLAR_v1c02670 [Spiroplasma clarkii]